MNFDLTPNNSLLRKESLYSLIYFAIYMTYMFIRPENELLHWISLVSLPIILIYIHHRINAKSFKECLASIGFSRKNAGSGILLALILGLLLGIFQLFFSGHKEGIWEIITSGKVLYMLPLTFVLMLFTAGFTEELFFRGVIQTRFAELFRSNFWAVIITTIFFIIYHIPYAYLNPNWPSYSKFWDAVMAVSVNGAMGGIVLGLVYIKAKRNLFAPIIVHSMINALPAMTMIKFNGG